MEISIIILGLIYISILTLSFVKRDWPVAIKKYLIVGHLICVGLMIVDLVLLVTTERTFRGVYIDRIIFWGLFITGGLFFSMFKVKRLWAKIYLGGYIFYPAIALITFFMDRILFVIFASPLIVSVLLPDIYYKNDKFEIRGITGLMAPRKIILIEKNLLTEKEIGRKEYDNTKDLEIKGIEILKTSGDSINARLDYGQRIELVTFKTGH